jgi:predicted alpha/beta superfamily hydrolase
MTTSNVQFPLVSIANSQLRHIRSSIVGQDYQVKIRLPEAYENTTTLYPVLYLLDGDHAFAMATDIVQYLIYGEHIPDLIIASPAYDSKKLPHEGGKNMRNRDLTPFPVPDTDMPSGAVRYLEFFQQELVPFVESNYRVSPSDRTLWGYSRGGLFALYALFEKPTLFQRYIIVDGFEDEFFNRKEDTQHNTQIYPSDSSYLRLQASQEVRNCLTAYKDEITPIFVLNLHS